MYKTVRHGENSLQYKILAQQEEGTSHVKCQKSTRTVTAKLITLIILLIIGIIASAVLVPLVLTNDFIALTGTFQKFSVSTLRRSHSGNHVVVIAKKPYGWNALRSSVSPRTSSASQTHPNDSRKSTATSELHPTTSEPASTAQKAKTGPAEPLESGFTTDHPRENLTSRKPAVQLTTSHIGKKQELMSPSTTVPAFLKRKSFQKEKAETEKTFSTSEPVWYEPVKKWGFESSNNFINGVNGVMINPMSILGSFFFIIVVVTMFFVLRKTLPRRRRNSTAKEMAESKEDKTRLLKPSGSSDHDEE